MVNEGTLCMMDQHQAVHTIGEECERVVVSNVKVCFMLEIVGVPATEESSCDAFSHFPVSASSSRTMAT